MIEDLYLLKSKEVYLRKYCASGNLHQPVILNKTLFPFIAN